MPDLKEKVGKLVKDFVDAVDEVEKDINEKDSESYKKFMSYGNDYLSDINENDKVDLPQPNENIYFVKGREDKKGKMFKNFDDAKTYAIETNKFLFQINGSDFYDKKMELKSLKQIDLTKDHSKKESVLGKISDYKKEDKNLPKPKSEKNKSIGMEM